MVQEVLFSVVSPSLKNYGERLGLIWGVVLLVGMVLPELQPGPKGLRLALPNIEGLWVESSEVPKFFLVYPLLAGIGMVLAAKLTRGYVRPLTMIGLGLLPVIVYAATESTRADLPADVSGLVAMLLLLAMFIGLRIQRGQPDAIFGRRLSGVCGIAWLVMLILPILPKEVGSILPSADTVGLRPKEVANIPLVMPFKLMDASVGMGLLVLLLLGALTAVAVTACLTLGRNPLRNQRLATLGNRILFVCMGVAPLLWMYVIFSLLYKQKVISEVGLVFGPILATLRLEAFIYGGIATLVVGALDLYTVVPVGWFSRVRAAARQWRTSIRDRAQAYEAVEEGSGTGVAGLIPPDSAAQLPTSAADARAMLAQLHELKKDGLITDEDFEARKKAILDKLVAG